MSIDRPLFAAGLVLGFTPLVSAQDVRVLLQENGALPNDPTLTVLSIDNPTANGIGGFALGLNADDGVQALDRIWGSVDGVAAPAVLFTQGTYGVFEQGSFEFQVGFSDAGEVGYSPSVTLGGVSGNDSVWVDDQPIAVEGNPIPSLPGKVWRFASRPDVIAATGEPVFVGGINDAGGAVEGNGLFVGTVPTPLIQSGDAVLGLPFPLSAGSSIDFDFRFSPNGLRSILPVDVDSGSANNDICVVKDLVGLGIGGLLVREEELMAPSLQLDPTERWDNFDFFAILDDGTHFFSGDTDLADLTRDEFVVRDDQIVLREGDGAGGGAIFSGSIESLSASPEGDLALVWDVNGGLDEALAFNGRAILVEGDGVDLDGDGLVDGTIAQFTGINALAVASGRRVYAIADVDTAGTSSTTDDVQVLLEIEVSELEASADSISLATGGSVDFTLFTRPEVQVDFVLMLGSLSGTSPGFTLPNGLTVPLAIDAFTSLTLELGPPTFSGFFGAPDTLGVADASFTLPAGLSPSLAGLVADFAYLSLSVAGSLDVTSVSNPVSVTIAP